MLELKRQTRCIQNSEAKGGNGASVEHLNPKFYGKLSG